MTDDSQGCTAYDLIGRLADYPLASYSLALTPDARSNEVIGDLKQEGTAQGLNVSEIRLEMPLRDLATLLDETPGPILVIDATSVPAATLGHALESARSLLPREKHIVIVLTPEAAGELVEAAPHFASFLRAVTPVEKENSSVMSREDAEAHLDALRTWSGLTDADVVERALAGTLPRDPEYGEWLVLIGRGDLV